MYNELKEAVLARINELRFEKVHLRPYIESDRIREEVLDKAIDELTWVLSLLSEMEDES
ncbi:MAG: hypothetical protein GX205_00095 [Firmicutes bacterium]|jgi:hypothetical protein|nr:hypothetical protein [Bacillota bacterium]